MKFRFYILLIISLFDTANCFSQNENLVINKKPNTYGWFYIIYSDTNITKYEFDSNNVAFVKRTNKKIRIYENERDITDSIRYAFSGKYSDSFNKIRFGYLKYYIISPEEIKLIDEKFLNYIEEKHFKNFEKLMTLYLNYLPKRKSNK